MTLAPRCDRLLGTTRLAQSYAGGDPDSFMADLDRLANSTASTVTTRLVIIIIPVLMAIIGYLASSKLDEIKETQGKFWGAVSTINSNLGDIKTNQATVTTALQSHTREDDLFETTVKGAILDHETRIRTLERPPLPPPRPN